MNTLESILSTDLDNDIDVEYIEYESSELTGHRPHLEFYKDTNKIDTIELPWTKEGTTARQYIDPALLDKTDRIFVVGENMERITHMPRSKITSAAQMARSSWVSSVDLTNMDFSKVTTASSLLAWNKHLVSADLTGLHTPVLTNLAYAFARCNALRDTAKIKGLDKLRLPELARTAYMFYACTSLEKAFFTNLRPSGSAESMFEDCKNLKSVMVRGIAEAESLVNLFADCEKLRSVDISGESHLNSTQDTQRMFKGCKNLKTVALSKELYEKLVSKRHYSGLTEEQMKTVKWVIR